MRYLLTLKYNGSHYFGWQRQNDVVTLQEVVENKLSTLFNTKIVVYASGRTDAKVHAKGQTLHFDAGSFPLKKLKYALNKMLPPDIEVTSVKKVDESFHARYSAISKTYEYVIYLGAKDVFLNDFVCFYPFDFDLGKIKEAAQGFLKTHSFANFTSKEEDKDNFVRTVYDIKIVKRGKKVRFIFNGDGFMRGQIRMMIGALLAINEGKEDSDYILKNLDVPQRHIIPYKVVGQGLYLVKVYY